MVAGKNFQKFFIKLSKKLEFSPPNTLMVIGKDKNKNQNEVETEIAQKPMQTAHQTATTTAPAGRMELWCRDPTPRRKKLPTVISPKGQARGSEHRVTATWL